MNPEKVRQAAGKLFLADMVDGRYMVLMITGEMQEGAAAAKVMKITDTEAAARFFIASQERQVAS